VCGSRHAQHPAFVFVVLVARNSEGFLVSIFSRTYDASRTVFVNDGHLRTRSVVKTNLW
jgi:hypothetical protein